MSRPAPARTPSTSRRRSSRPIKASDNFSIINNTFYDYLNRYNQMEDYYADTAKGSYTIENKTDFNFKFSTGSVNHDIDAGFTYRYAHVWDVQNYVNEPVSVFDLSGSPELLGLPRHPSRCGDGNFPYYAAFNHYPIRHSRHAIHTCRTPASFRTCRTPPFSSSIASSSRRSGACCTGCAAIWCS